MSSLPAVVSPVSTTPIPDFEVVKVRQQAMWASADFGQIGVRLQVVGESLCEAAEVSAADHVLDVAAGNGNASLAAARRFANVTATDYVPALLEDARLRAGADRLPMTFKVADAEALPFPDASFDVALSTFGVMFAPNQPRAAGELMRVVRPGGRIGLANWTPEGFLGDMFRVMARFVPPPAGVASPLTWGTEARLRELFGPAPMRVERKHYVFHYRSAAHFVEFFKTNYGPTHKAFAALDEDAQRGLRDALAYLLRGASRSGRALAVPAEYLEVVIAR